MIPSRLYLCGFMGSGKSTVGPMLATRLNYHFADTDADIERREGATIAAIFGTQGEARFRTLETEALQSLSGQKSLVVALGGGILMNPDHLALVRKSGFLIYLRTALPVIKNRLRGVSDRPLLKSGDLESLLAARKPGFEQADFVIDTDDRTPEGVVEGILSTAFFEL